MSNPNTYNHLDNVKFKFQIHRCPNVNYWMQSVQLPSMQLEQSTLPGMRRDVPVPGSKVEFETLIVNFIVDQNLDNYYEVYKWFQQIQVASEISEMVSDCSLHFLDGNNNVNRTIDFVGAYPLLMTELALNSDDSDTVPVTCSVSFNYRYFKFADESQPSWA